MASPANGLKPTPTHSQLRYITNPTQPINLIYLPTPIRTIRDGLPMGYYGGALHPSIRALQNMSRQSDQTTAASETKPLALPS